MDVQQAIDDAARGKLLPVYVIQGTERMLVQRTIDALRKATVGGGARGLAEDHFEASEAKPAKVLDACRMIPMLSRWRFVLVRGIDDWKADELEAVLAYADKPTPTSVLVLLTDKVDGRLRFGQQVKKKGLLVDAVAPSERELPRWLESEARRRGTTFGPGAADSLALTVGADLSALSDALDKLQLFAGARPITDKDVDTLIADVREASQFELPDAVGDRNLARALTLAHHLSRQREPGLLVLTFVVRQIRILARARDAIERGDDVGSALRLPPFLVGKVTGQSKKWSSAQLANALKACAQADLRLKSGGGRDRDARVIEELILTLVG